MIDAFEEAFNASMKNEGGYSNRSDDPGGETYRGISRVFHPDWIGWKLVSVWKSGGMTEAELLNALDSEVKKFYRNEFWVKVRGDEIAALSPAVAAELFDTAVNMHPLRAAEFFQTALNRLNIEGQVYPDLLVDGLIGQKTINTLKRYLQYQPSREDNEQILINCMNGEQYIFYVKNPRHERFRGWFRRV